MVVWWEQEAWEGGSETPVGIRPKDTYCSDTKGGKVKVKDAITDVKNRIRDETVVNKVSLLTRMQKAES